MTRRNRHIKAAYFNWLYDQVLTVRDPDSPISYVYVCMVMHSMPFMDNVPNDDNRTAEGIELREEFTATLRNLSLDEYTDLHSMGDRSSIFEMLIALCRRCNYMVEIGDQAWFWKFLENLGLIRYSDSRYRERDRIRITRILETMNERKYDKSGIGSLFPLKRPGGKDQRNTELWYQMAHYMKENHM